MLDWQQSLAQPVNQTSLYILRRKKMAETRKVLVLNPVTGELQQLQPGQTVFGLTTADIAAKHPFLVSEIERVVGLIGAETTARTTGDNAAADALAAEITRITGVITDAVSAEAGLRTTAVGALQTELDRTQETVGLAIDGTLLPGSFTNSAAGATTLVSAINAVAAAAGGGVDGVQAELDRTQAGAGLSADGTYAADTLTNFISTATSLKGADALLDAALQTEVTRATAAEGVLRTDLQTEVDRATAAERALTTAITAEVDRATAAEGALDGRITTLGTTVNTLDDRITALGNAFNYIGAVAGGASGTATDLGLLPADQRDAGDYFKVEVAGYFKVGVAGAEFFANVGDGLVWNVAGGVDKIDNTDSNVAGTANEIAVTGSADTGFTVGIATEFKGRVTTLETGLTTEIAARDAADVALEGLIEAERIRAEGVEAILVRDISELATTVTAGAGATTTAASTTAAAVGDAVYVSAGGAVSKAQADVAATVKVAGFVGAAGSIVTSGVVRNTGWALTPGARYFLSTTTAGALTNVVPTTGWVAPVGIALSATDLVIQIGTPIEL